MTEQPPHSHPHTYDFPLPPAKGIHPVAEGYLHPTFMPPEAEAALTAGLRHYTDPFVGVTTDGTPKPGLYEFDPTTQDLSEAIAAARTYLELLPPSHRHMGNLPMDSAQWRLWTNAFPSWVPTGARLGGLDAEVRESALKVMQVSLSPEGYRTVREAMKLNAALGDIIDDYRDTLTEFNYWFTIFGHPGEDAWGWKLMGHHVALHCVFVGAHTVLAPTFIGAEPTKVTTGPYAGSETLTAETDLGLALRRVLTTDQESRFLLGTSMLSKDLPPELAGPFNGRHLGGAGSDNLVLAPEGITAPELTKPQRERLLRLVEVYMGRLPAPQAARRMRQFEHHLDDTYFAWRGGHGDTSPFYYRIHSPVALIEYDNHPGIFLGNTEPERFHVHTIVREPNGNDYGRNLLAQHYAEHHQKGSSHVG